MTTTSSRATQGRSQEFSKGEFTLCQRESTHKIVMLFVQRFITHLHSNCSRYRWRRGLLKLSINVQTLEETNNATENVVTKNLQIGYI